MANTFKKVIDRMMWAQVAPSTNAHAAGTSLASDSRNDISRNPFAYALYGPATLSRYNIITKSWLTLPTPALAGSVAAGAGVCFAPSLGLVGTIAAGATTTSVVLSTALPTAVGVNMLANRGGSGDYGFKIRIIDTTAGKTAERFIISNSSGTTPTIQVLSSFGFTPSTGARYEILAGKVWMLAAGALAANSWRSLETATNTYASGSTTNLAATIGTDANFLVLDEQYVPFDCKPGEGMIKGSYVYDTGVSSINALAATASAASTITGQATGGDAVVAANEFRNFQLRIVEDTTTPAAVGQRRIIASHTAGASPVYTLGTAWTTQPSSSAKYVIELPNLIVLRSSGTTTTYTYNYGDATVNNGTNSIAANAWSTTYFGAGPAAQVAGGAWCPGWGIRPDAARNARQSVHFYFRGGAVTLDSFDIAGSITGTWTGAITYDGNVTLTASTSVAHSPFGNEGRYSYLNLYTASAVNQIFRFDALNRVLTSYTPTDFIQSGTAAVGNRMTAYVAIDGADLYDVILLQSHTSTICQELIPLV